MITITIDEIMIEVEEGTTILQAAKKAGIDIPYLCRDDRIDTRNCMEYGDCKICSCEIEGMDGLITTCNTLAEDGMKVFTETEAVVKARRSILYEKIAKHPQRGCLSCKKPWDCKLLNYGKRYKATTPLYEIPYKHREIDDSLETFYTEFDKCILCGKCVRICRELVGVEALRMLQRGIDNLVVPTSKTTMAESGCLECGNCVSACPVGALMPKKDIQYRVWEDREIETHCMGCGMACAMKVRADEMYVGDVLPADGCENYNLLCKKGKFEFWCPDERILKPVISVKKQDQIVTWKEAFKQYQNLIKVHKEKYGEESIAAVCGYGLTDEEKSAFLSFAKEVLKANQIVEMVDDKEAFTPLPVSTDKNIDVIKSRCMNCMVRCESEENLTVPIRTMRKAIVVNAKNPEKTHCVLNKEALKEANLIFVVGEVDSLHIPKRAVRIFVASHPSSATKNAELIFPACLEIEKEGHFTGLSSVPKEIVRCVPNPEEILDLEEILEILGQEI